MREAIFQHVSIKKDKKLDKPVPIKLKISLLYGRVTSKVCEYFPPEQGRRRVSIILFDSRIKDRFIREMMSIEEAKRFLKKIKPKGQTTIR
ncbi:MAG: hypothetical protein DRI57_18745 [Deltaproteobacteria bacterium]|nr:MAG: hypothetical protein DRI57_18745 [Deltaproteobacteria bacterium]